MTVITPEEFARQMNEIYKESGGAEQTHLSMDNLMCRVLESLGYEEGIEIFKTTSKWYA